MNFFCTKEHYLQWIAKRGISPEDNFGLDAEDALHAAKFLFG